MRMPKAIQDEIYKSLDVLSDDTRTASFYYHDVFDNDASTRDAKKRAVIQAREEERLYNKGLPREDHKIIAPDFTPDNLKKLGAVAVYKKVLYVKIQHHGSKEIQSRVATEQDKLTFKQAWSLFDEHIQKETKKEINQKSTNKRNDHEAIDTPRENGSFQREIKQSTENAIREGNIQQGWQEIQRNTVGFSYDNQKASQVTFNYEFQLS